MQHPSSLRKATKLVTALSVAVSTLVTLAPHSANPASAAVFAPTAGSPEEFILDLDNRGLPFVIGSYTNSMGFQNYQIMNIEGATVSDADAGYPGHDLVVDFQGDSSDWWFAPEGYGDQGNDLHGFMYDAGAPAGSKYAYFVFEASPLSNSPSYIGRVDNNGVFSHIAHIDRPSGVLHSDHEWTMLSNGDLILFNSPTGTLQNFGNLRSLSTDYTYDNKHQSPTLTIQSETQAGQEMPELTFDTVGGLLQTAVIDIGGVEHVLVIDSDTPPTYGIHLFNASTLAYVGELDPAGSTGVEGEANAWTTTAGPAVEATASIGGTAYLVYSTPDTVMDFSPVAGRYAMGKITGADVDLVNMTVNITSHLTDVEMKNRVSLGIQAPAAIQTLDLPPELPAISYLVYDANGGQQNTSPAADTDAVSTDVAINSGTPTYTGYNFMGWNSSADGTGTSYDAGDTYTLPPNAGDVATVFAQWAQAGTSSPLSCSAWAGLIWLQNQYDPPSNDYQAANTSQFFLFDPATGALDSDGLSDASTWIYDDAALGYNIDINGTGIDPASNIMYGSAKIDGGSIYVASFAPGEDPVFYAKNRETASGDVLSGFGVGAVDAEGYYWIKNGDTVYRSQQPLSSYAGFADYNDVTDPMVFDAIGTVGLASDAAVIPTADGYLFVGAFANGVHWGTWNSTTGLWTEGTSVTELATGSGLNDYGAVFVDGVSGGGDYSDASIYLMPNAGWDPETDTGRHPLKISVADALDGITESDIVRLEATKTPATSSNDGSSMVGCGLQLPDPLGGLHGWVWQDADDNGLRATVEPTAGLFGAEGVVTNYEATVISEFDWTTLQGVVVVPAGTRYPATVDTDGRWSVEGLAAGADPSGQLQTFKVEFDLTNADGWLAGFTPDGFVIAEAMPTSAISPMGGISPLDSDIVEQDTLGVVGTSNGGIDVVADTSTHAADAGVVNAPPPGELDVTWYAQCAASNDGSADIWVTEFVNTYNTDATFELYFGSTLIASQVVPAGQTLAGTFWEFILPYQSPIRFDGTVNGNTEVLSNSGNGCEKVSYIIYEEQGGDEVADDSCIYGLGSFTIPAAPSRDGYTFVGWNSASDGSGTAYNIGQTYDCDDLVIYAIWEQIPAPPVVIFEEQGGDEVTDPVCTTGGTFTIPAAPSRDGFTFVGWNSASDGSGTEYVIGQTYGCDDLTIYAVWEQIPPPPVVIFEEQGGDEVTDPLCTTGGSFTIPAAPSRDGFTFVGWNSAADGSGTEYGIGQVYGCDDLVIYAVWEQTPVSPPPVVIFEEQGGDDVADPVCTTGGTFTVPAAPSRDGYNFVGWNSASDGSGTAYNIGQVYDCDDLTIYALWEQIPAPPVVIFEEQGGDDVADPVCTTGGTFTIPAPLSYDGYTFVEWNSESDGSGTEYIIGQSYNCDDLVIYAVWEQTPVPPVVVFDEQGGDEVTDPVCTTGGTFTVPAPLSRDGYTFVGWNSASDGSGTVYSIGQTYDCDDLVIFAIWTPVADQVELPNTGARTNLLFALISVLLGSGVILSSAARRREVKVRP